MTPQRRYLPDGRLHFSHGPIDLIIQAEGDMDTIEAAHQRAWRRFEGVLTELVGELAQLRHPTGEVCPVSGTIATRMWNACYPYRTAYITPMAAVAGSVAEEIIAFYARPGIDRAAINNGGDIALHLGDGQSYRIGVCSDIPTATNDAVHGMLAPDAEIVIDSAMPVRGIATSGWRGRSFSLGIADSVTVLAGAAAQADTAATMIANAVNVQDARIRRAPACQLKDDSDLGDLPVTVDVPPLERSLINHALDAGLARARQLQEKGLIWSVLIMCQGQAASLQGREKISAVHSDETRRCMPEAKAVRHRTAGFEPIAVKT
jgi:ApbE superfamily uncharacterized protein (UPF0280 family)